MQPRLFSTLASGNTKLDMTTSSARVALPGTVGNDAILNVRIYNAGAVDAHVVLGNSAVAAVADGTAIVIPPGWVEYIEQTDLTLTHLAGITGSGVTTIYISRGRGV